GGGGGAASASAWSCLREWRARSRAAGGVHAVLKAGKRASILGGGVSEGVLIGTAVCGVILVQPRLGFGGTEAAEVPLAVDELVYEAAGFGGGGIETAVALLDEFVELGDVFGGEGEGFGVDAGFEGIHGGGGLACNRGGAGGF
ncbi:MAG TPA: hypothetical protein VGK96_07485, partial [Candidatus Sulfotelmatobacter sp.]